MSLKLLYAILLTVLPITELRAGLPVAISYARDSNTPVFLIFILIVLVNILLIFFIFFFLDRVHKILLKWKFYKRTFEKFLNGFQKKVKRFEKRHKAWGILALTLFVAIPLPGSGAWTGCLLAWLLNLDRKKSILAISLGVLIAGLLILLLSLGFIGFFGKSSS